MCKPEGSSRFLATFRSYTSNATVHGLSYIGDLSLPLVDRVVWSVVVVVFGACAAYLSHGVFQAWQSNLVVTMLKETELPVTKLDFPAITICNEGLNMEAVENVIEAEYEEWKQRTKRNAVEDNDVIKDVEKFLLTTYGIEGDQDIFDIISGMVAEEPDKSFANNGIRKAMNCNAF